MPELPEVETIRRGLEGGLIGRRIAAVVVRRSDLRWPLPADFKPRLEGRQIRAIGRRAKYLLVHLDDETVWMVHLGMAGRMWLLPDAGAPAGPHDHVDVATDDGSLVRFTDARRFGMMDLTRQDALAGHRLLAALGPEPLGNDFNGPALAAALRGKKTPIKAALLDQKVVAGIGNIYACEALYRAGLSPRRSAHTVQRGRAERLSHAVRAVLEDAIASGGSSLRDYVQASGELGYFQHRFRVYDREGEPCPTAGCAAPVRRIVQSARSTFYCASCQR